MENVLDTFIGEDCPVKVRWDYEEAEKQTHDHPGCPDAVIINAVEVLSLGYGKDILDDLSDKCLETLIGRCRDWLNEQWAAEYEQEQQER
jgi:hypothetical protein